MSGRLHQDYGPTLANKKLSERDVEQCLLKAMGNMTTAEKRLAIHFTSERDQTVNSDIETC